VHTCDPSFWGTIKLEDCGSGQAQEQQQQQKGKTLPEK
jgi:hypothetical protein